MVISMDDFKVNECYGIHTEDNVTIIGSLQGKEHIETIEGQADNLIVKVYNSDSSVRIPLDIIEHYFIIEGDDNTTESKIYNDALLEYGVNLGDTTTQVLGKYIEKWNEFDNNKKEFLVQAVISAISSFNIKDMIDALVSAKKESNEIHKKYLAVLDNHVEFIKKYEECKDAMPKGIGKIYDMFLSDVCGMKL